MELYTITIYIRDYDDYSLDTFVKEDYQSALSFAISERESFKHSCEANGYYERNLEGTCIDAYFKDNDRVSFEATIKKHEVHSN